MLDAIVEEFELDDPEEPPQPDKISPAPNANKKVIFMDLSQL